MAAYFDADIGDATDFRRDVFHTDKRLRLRTQGHTYNRHEPSSLDMRRGDETKDQSTYEPFA